MTKKHGKDLSSNDFTDGYKKKLDSIGKIYKFKGNVNTYTELSTISATNGDVYNVLDEGKNYAWNEIEWIELGFIIDMSEFAYQTEVDEIKTAIDNKNIITVGLSANQTIETHGLNTLNTNKIISQLGDKFTLKDGKVYVGSGINYVLVSCNIYTNLSSDRTSGSFNLCIKKNGTEVSQALNSNSVKGTNDTRTLPPKLVAVKEGDYFELEVYMCVNDVISSVQGRTFMTIQAIA